MPFTAIHDADHIADATANGLEGQNVNQVEIEFLRHFILHRGKGEIAHTGTGEETP